MLILILSYILCFYTSPKFSLTVFKSSLTKVLQALIEIFQREYNTWSTSKCLNFSASITQFCKENLNKPKFIYNIQMTISIYRLIKRWCKLLLWVNKSKYSIMSSRLLKCRQKSLVFFFYHASAHFDHFDVKCSQDYLYFSFNLTDFGYHLVLSRSSIYIFQNALFDWFRLFLSTSLHFTRIFLIAFVIFMNQFISW